MMQRTSLLLILLLLVLLCSLGNSFVTHLPATATVQYDDHRSFPAVQRVASSSSCHRKILTLMERNEGVQTSDEFGSSSRRQTPIRAGPRQRQRQRQRQYHSKAQRIQLIRLVDSILYFPDQEWPESIEAALRSLKSSPTSYFKAAVEMTRQEALIWSLVFGESEIYEQRQALQERWIKLWALLGNADVALNGWKCLKQRRNMITYTSTSDTCTVALLSVLRKDNRIDDLQNIWQGLTEMESRSTVASNIYLAALCESRNSTLLEEACQMVLDKPNKNNAQWDITSYNTLLKGAAKMRNVTLMNDVWKTLQKHSGLRPNVRSYNARLSLKGQSQEKALGIWDELSTNLHPDRYSIDLILPTLWDARQQECHTLLKDFIRSSDNASTAAGFAAFLNTLVSSNRIAGAEQLFHDYLLANLECLETRHFNILIDGYRKQASGAALEMKTNASASRSNETSSTTKDNKELEARLRAQELFQLMKQLNVTPDAYTLTSVMDVCNDPDHILKLLVEHDMLATRNPAVVRSAITACGKLQDPYLACRVLDHYDIIPSQSIRLWNALLGCLETCARQGTSVIRPHHQNAIKMGSLTETNSRTEITSKVVGRSCTEAVRKILETLEEEGPNPTAQTYCVAAAALQYDPNAGHELAIELYRNATTKFRIPADGRFVNALFRCFGEDLTAALDFWKSSLRKDCLEYEQRPRRDASQQQRRKFKKNLIAAYNGLLHICGRAQRPDLGVRIVYAMNREGIEPDEVSLNNYRAGKRISQQSPESMKAAQEYQETSRSHRHRFLGLFSSRGMLLQQEYESILYVECTKYNVQRMSKYPRVRIIV